jgi:hypothetical protein
MTPSSSVDRLTPKTRVPVSPLTPVSAAMQVWCPPSPPPSCHKCPHPARRANCHKCPHPARRANCPPPVHAHSLRLHRVCVCVCMCVWPWCCSAPWPHWQPPQAPHQPPLRRPLMAPPPCLTGTTGGGGGVRVRHTLRRRCALVAREGCVTVAPLPLQCSALAHVSLLLYPCRSRVRCRTPPNPQAAQPGHEAEPDPAGGRGAGDAVAPGWPHAAHHPRHPRYGGRRCPQGRPVWAIQAVLRGAGCPQRGPPAHFGRIASSTPRSPPPTLPPPPREGIQR